jgi:hypothetical protein
MSEDSSFSFSVSHDLVEFGGKVHSTGRTIRWLDKNGNVVKEEHISKR